LVRISSRTSGVAVSSPSRDRFAAHDLDARRGTDAGRAGLDHLLHVFGRANAAGRLDAQLGPDRLAHQADVLDRGAAAGESGRGLHEVGARRLGQ
jgi:hypothetical protein